MPDSFSVMFNTTELETRISHAKHFLNSEMTHVRVNRVSNKVKINEIGLSLDTLHEAERIGIRNLNEVEYSRVSRVLTSIEARMALSGN